MTSPWVSVGPDPWSRRGSAVPHLRKHEGDGVSQCRAASGHPILRDRQLSDEKILARFIMAAS
jgi:hypothetical protein